MTCEGIQVYVLNGNDDIGSTGGVGGSEGICGTGGSLNGYTIHPP
jgi:hypothetical protein